jgi:hypothetical protein
VYKAAGPAHPILPGTQHTRVNSFTTQFHRCALSEVHLGVLSPIRTPAVKHRLGALSSARDCPPALLFLLSYSSYTTQRHRSTHVLGLCVWGPRGGGCKKGGSCPPPFFPSRPSQDSNISTATARKSTQHVKPRSRVAVKCAIFVMALRHSASTQLSSPDSINQPETATLISTSPTALNAAQCMAKQQIVFKPFTQFGANRRQSPPLFVH